MYRPFAVYMSCTAKFKGSVCNVYTLSPSKWTTLKFDFEHPTYTPLFTTDGDAQRKAIRAERKVNVDRHPYMNGEWQDGVSSKGSTRSGVITCEKVFIPYGEHGEMSTPWSCAFSSGGQHFADIVSDVLKRAQF